jgi:hypothetical protein
MPLVLGVLEFGANNSHVKNNVFLLASIFYVLVTLGPGPTLLFSMSYT